MKVVKLGSRYVLARHGFTHALRFNRDCRESDAVKKALYKIHPGSDPWNIWWKHNNAQARWGYYKDPKRSIYWVGVKNKADLTAAILMAQMTDV